MTPALSRMPRIVTHLLNMTILNESPTLGVSSQRLVLNVCAAQLISCPYILYIFFNLHSIEMQVPPDHKGEGPEKEIPLYQRFEGYLGGLSSTNASGMLIVKPRMYLLWVIPVLIIWKNLKDLFTFFMWDPCYPQSGGKHM
jgi:hypothetical protein